MDKTWERRKYTRVSDKLQILYEVVSCKKIGEYITRDIGQGGVRFLVHDFIPKDSYLKIKLTSQSHINYEALVRVVWINKNHCSEDYEVGVEFINMPLEAQKHLIDHIKACEAAAK